MKLAFFCTPTIAAVLSLVLLAGVAAPARASSEGEVSGPPSLVDLTWLPRGGTPADPILELRLAFAAPAGLESGELRLGSVHHEILAGAELGPYQPGTHTVSLQVSPPGDKARPWEANGLTLRGGDGQTTTYGFCDLAAIVETREDPGRPRLGLECLDGSGWVVYTVRAEVDAPAATIWMRGVAMRRGTYAAMGDVMQNTAGEVLTWGTGLALAHPQPRDGTVVSIGGEKIVDDPAPDPSEEPGPHRLVIGVGGQSASALTPGAVYRWGAYFAARPNHFDLPRISLEGSGLTVLGVETGPEASIAWGDDFDHSIAIQRSSVAAAIEAHGEATRTFERSATCMFAFLGDPTAGIVPSTNVGHIEGPGASMSTGVVVTGQPGPYRFNATAGIGGSSGQHVVGCADMPLTPQ